MWGATSRIATLGRHWRSDSRRRVAGYCLRMGPTRLLSGLVARGMARPTASSSSIPTSSKPWTSTGRGPSRRYLATIVRRPRSSSGLATWSASRIFEAAAGGLFIPAEAGVRPGNFVTLPNQPIDTKGYHLRSLCRPGTGRRQDALAGGAGDRRPHQEPSDRAAGGGGAGDPEYFADHRRRRGEQC